MSANAEPTAGAAEAGGRAGAGAAAEEPIASERVFRFYGDVEQELRGAVRAALQEKCPLSAVAQRFDAADPVADRELWAVLGGQLGVAGLLVPEVLGGAGATAREAAVVLEEAGRAVAPVPFLTSAVWATVLLGAGVEPAEVAGRLGLPAAEALRALASGEKTAAVAVRADTAPGSAFPDAIAASVGDGEVRLRGSVSGVVGACDADLLLVPARIGDVASVLLVEADAVTRSKAVSLDESRPVADLVFDDVPATIAAADAEPAFEHALVVASALLASEQLGVAERCLEETVAHVKTRHQFGRPIGSFQAVKHRLADLWVQVEDARTAARYAATCAATGSADLPVASALAAAYCAEAAVKAAEECVQLHGGIGFTWEHPAHLWLKRAMAQGVLFGGADRQRARLAVLAGLAAPWG